nr:transposase [Roseovarius tolerans]
MADWSLTSLQTRMIKIGARVVRHARDITFQLAEDLPVGMRIGFRRHVLVMNPDPKAALA